MTGGTNDVEVIPPDSAARMTIGYFLFMMKKVISSKGGLSCAKAARCVERWASCIAASGAGVLVTASIKRARLYCSSSESNASVTLSV